MRRRAVGWGMAWLAMACAAGCGSDRIDPPRGEDAIVEDVAPEIDSLVTWAQRARTRWAAGDTTGYGEAGALARAAFAGAWLDVAGGAGSDRTVRDSEHLPARRDAALPTAEGVRERLAGLGLAADIVAATGPIAVWQVVLADPTGRADASTEFWAWPDPESPLGPPVLQPLPAQAPARARYGPEAVGTLVTYARPKGLGLASAWTRPRGANGVEVALLERSGEDDTSWSVASSRVLPVLADSIGFIPAEGVPELVLKGPGGKDRLFDECPTCPHVERRQRYVFEGATWSLREERSELTPYAAIVSFMHALREGGLDAALPYAAGPEVLEQARELGLERGPIGRLRATPGSDAMDRTQRFRRGGSGGSDGLEITLDAQGERWVVSDLRPTRLVIE